MLLIADPESEEEVTIIAVTELLTLINFAVVQGPKWKGMRVVIYVTDNMLVKGWLRKRKARHPHARLLLRLLHRRS